MNQNTKNHGRVDLKKLFENGSIPTANDFGFLIDSTINKHDDGFEKDEDDGMIIKATNSSKRLVSFYKDIQETESFFSIDLHDKGQGGIKISPSVNDDSETGQANNEQGPVGTNQAAGDASSSFFFHADGKLGIGKPANRKYALDVNGFTASKGRIGTFKTGTVPADGHWHPVIEHLNNCQAFELVARTGLANSGRFAILHAFALSAFGGRSKSRIRKTSAYYGFFWNKIKVKWGGNTQDYSLMLKTNRHYGHDQDGNVIRIFYNITKLWDDENFLPQEYFHSHSQPG